MKKVVTAEDVRAVPAGGEVVATPGAVVTDWAREVAATRGVRIVLAAGATPGPLLVAVGADHGGFALKEEVKAHLTRLGYRFHDFGTHSTEAVDYPDVALEGRARHPLRRSAPRDPRGRRRPRLGHGRQQGPRRARRALPGRRRPPGTRASTTTPTSSPWARASSTWPACRRSSRSS